ncbi:MAG: 2-amino-4-hydroxy-6-hydroxymethyldihydropteridine diphosphokinase [bacterium]|nr:2-amino-4-hydroxy-6-hydroxymethyldihydropteridine diphosphokinase [bacterium]
MAYALILLGSNIEPLKNIEKAHSIISLYFDVIFKSESIKTRPYKIKGDFFLNSIVFVKTKYSLKKFLEILKKIEKKLGRTLEEHGYKSRKIDIDVLFFYSKKSLYLNRKELLRDYTFKTITSMFH